MACLNKNNNINISIEDLLLTRDKRNTQTIYDNMDMYKKIIFDIIEWINSKSHIKNFDYIVKFNSIYSKFINKYRVICKKSILIYVYRNMLRENEVIDNPLIWKLLQKRPVRNMSGVTVITLLTSPYPHGQDFSCKHNCYYCPNEPGQPRSYLKKEPAVARANRNKFDPILQTEDRIKALIICGQEIDKLEFIIEGGTYTEYPPAYLEEFHRDFIYCVNTYFDTVKREKLSIKEEIEINKTASIKIIGICIETRPDALFDSAEMDTTDGNKEPLIWLRRFREWGVTRVQLGVQHIDNDILKKVNRGHTIEDSENAIQYLKDNCFKVDIHLMPDLPFTTPEKDKKMIDYVFNTPNLQPDQVKIYFCEVTPWTVIQKWFKDGKYKPYAQTDEKALFDVAKHALKQCPPWVRIPRVIRDIPLSYIEGGNMYPNLRQMLMSQLENEGYETRDIRAREYGRNTKYNPNDAVLYVREYETKGGMEYFISFESEDKKCLFGFLRLRLRNEGNERNENNENNQKDNEYVNRYCVEFDCLKNRGLIRELHIYGIVTPVGHKKDGGQHMGFGKRLLEHAEKITLQKGYLGIAVISGIGVMGYYEKNGYYYQDTFMLKELTNNNLTSMNNSVREWWNVLKHTILNPDTMDDEMTRKFEILKSNIEIIITIVVIVFYIIMFILWS